MNENNPVTGVLLDNLLVGSMYAEQQSAYLNSYETGLSKSDVENLVASGWGISDKNDAVEILEGLHVRNEDASMDVVYQAFEDGVSDADVLRSKLPESADSFDYYLDKLNLMGDIVPNLIEEKVITDFSMLRKIKDSGWNYGRAAYLARCCYELGYLSERDLKEYLEKSRTELKKYCSTWKEYTASYIFGRAVWGGGHNDGMVVIANKLLNNEKSPLKNKTYI